jgi:hypothetical protein
MSPLNLLFDNGLGLSAPQASPTEAREGAPMKRIALIAILVLTFAVALVLVIGTAGDQEIASIDIRRPTTILSLVASRLHAIPSYVRELIDGATAGFRETIGKHESPKKSLER